MAIIVKETHREGSSVHVAVLDPGTGKQVYDRYVPESEWDADPEAVAASISNYIDEAVTAPKPAIRPAVKGTVTMTSKQVDDKLALLAKQKASADSKP